MPEIEVSCPGCNVVFTVPVELGGEIAECSECGAVFEIPKMEEIKGEQGYLAETGTGAIQGKITEESETASASNTVKLSRTGIGMIPTLKDSFTFGDASAAPSLPPSAPSIESLQFKTQIRGSSTPQAPPPVRTAASPAVSAPPPRPPSGSSPAGQKPVFKKPAFSPPSEPSAVASRPQPSPTGTSKGISPQFPPWVNIQIRPDEQVYAFREIKKNPVGVALLLSLPVLLSIAAVAVAKPDAIIAYVVIVAIWIATFVVIAAVASGRKACLVFTSTRAILICGKDRTELKK